MEINWYGSFFILLSILIVINFRKIRFIDLFVFCIPFNSTAVFFVGGTALSLPLILFFFSFFSFLLILLTKKDFSYSRKLVTNFNWLFIIATAAIVSQIMPFIINGDYKVLDRYKSLVFYAKEVPLIPDIQWVTQLFYFLIGILIIFLIAVNYRSEYYIKRFFKFFLGGIVFMIFWGWFEYFCFFTGIHYPYEVFDHMGMSRRGTLIASNGLPRMISVTMEASYFAQILIPATPFFYWFGQNKAKINIFSKTKNRFFFVISIISLLIAQTSTGVLGFLMIIGLLLKNRIRNFSKNIRILLIILFSLLCIIGLVFSILILIEKSGNYSGIERLKTVTLGIKYFFDYPLLGLGWGVFPTYDFLINLLANFGLLGTVPFLILLRNIYFRMKIKKNSSPVIKAGIESLLFILIVSQLSGFIYHSQYFWVYIGLALSISTLDKTQFK